jgi:phage shock protein PspC (stress-responsive transcriptional regulator)
MKIQTILKRLKEPSTWAGIAGLAVLFGVDPVKINAITTAAVAVASGVAIVLPESKPAPEQGA